jgi:hypothetical protein
MVADENEIDKVVPVDNAVEDNVMVPDILIEPVGYDKGRIQYIRRNT